MQSCDEDVRPLTADRWDDLVDLFGPQRGAASGCWCMWPFLRGRDWKAMPRDERRDALKEKAESGPPPGLLAYRGGEAVGWVAFGPRAGYIRFQLGKNSRPLETDGEDLIAATYVIPCFYMRRGHRGSGLMPLLLQAAVDAIRDAGASHVDACPIDPDRQLQWGEGFVGIAKVFRRAGFTEIARRHPTRPLMRLSL